MPKVTFRFRLGFKAFGLAFKDSGRYPSAGRGKPEMVSPKLTSGLRPSMVPSCKACKAKAGGLARRSGLATWWVGAKLYFTTAPRGSGNPVGSTSRTPGCQLSMTLAIHTLLRAAPSATSPRSTEANRAAPS